MLAVAVVTKRPWLAATLARTIISQDTRPEMITVVTVRDDFPTDDFLAALNEHAIAAEVAVVDPASSLGAMRNLAVSRTASVIKTGHVANMDDDDWYGPRYLTELAALSPYNGGAIVGKRRYWMRWVHPATGEPIPEWEPISRHGGHPVRDDPNRVTWVAGATAALPAALWLADSRFRYPQITGGEDTQLIGHARALGVPIVTSSPDNFYAQRWGTDPAGGDHEHTWRVHLPYAYGKSG